MNKLEQIFVETLGLEPEEINDNLKIGQHDLWDSLGHLSLIDQLEKSFNIEFSHTDMPKMRTFTDIKNLLEEKKVSF